MRALRGATTASGNSASDIVDATAELLGELLARNGIALADLISIIFTASPDLDATFPAAAARALGIADVPLLCAREIDVPGALPRCIRVLVHFEARGDDLVHVYLRDARKLRSDLADNEV